MFRSMGLAGGRSRSGQSVERRLYSPRDAVFSVLVWIAAASGFAPLADAQVNVTTMMYDIGRTGQNLNETALNTSNVNTAQFGKLFSQLVDGQIYAQPLYVAGLSIAGVKHNVVFVATEHDSVYAFDADSSAGANATALWQAALLSTTHGAAAGATTVPWASGSDIYPEVGITGTPVIDTTTNTLYVVSKSVEAGSQVQRLHALDITSGAEKFGGPVKVAASTSGTASDSVGGILTFNPMQQNQRPGLLLLHGIVYAGWASHEDGAPWHGWIIGYNAGTLLQTGVFCSSPNGSGSGIWMSGNGLAADQLDTVNHPYGRMFVATGNGDFTATKPYTGNMDYGDSHLNLDLSNGVPTVTDEFTTNTQAALNSNDGDVGAGGLLVLPHQSSGNNPNLLVQASKAGTLYLLNRENLGGYNTAADQSLQEQPYAVGDVGVWSAPAYWNGTVYYFGQNDHLKSFPIVNGLLSTTPTVSNVTEYAFPGATPAVSANGTSQGIIWSINPSQYGSSNAAVLEAYDATNVLTRLYASSMNTNRDTAGPGVKFAVPTVANGKVYVGTKTEVDIFGLLNGLTQTNSPSFSPGSETFIGSASVTISDSTPGTTIYYTTDGTAPTTSSTVYKAPLSLVSTETVKAIATAPGLLISAAAAATYSISATPDVPKFNLPTGIYTSAQRISLSNTTPGSVIYYTTNGSTPTTASLKYSAPISVSATETITAMAAVGANSSAALAQTYTIEPGASGLSYPTGFPSAAAFDINGPATLAGTALQLTSGVLGQASSAWAVTPVNIQSFVTDFTFQIVNPGGDGLTFTIQNSPNGAGALGGNGGQLGYQGITNSVAVKFDLNSNAGEGVDSTGVYLNGAAPTVPSSDMTASGVNLHSGDSMGVHLAYDGTTLTMKITDLVTAATFSVSWTVNIPSTVGANTAYVGFTGACGASVSTQNILSWTFYSNGTTTPASAAPTFSPAAGSYTGAQTVTLSDATAGSTIYYTVNGTTPTTASTVYSTPFSVGATETVNAIAVASGYTTSAVASAVYTITVPAAATPTFSPAAGTYANAQTVKLSDTTTGSTIYYTVNGTTPTTASTVYSAPLSVSATETVKAIAGAAGYSTSALASAAYTITVPATATPTFSPAAGSYTSTQTVVLSDATTGATIYYTTNGTTPTTASAVYSAPLSVSSSATVNAIAVASGYATSATGSAAYTISTVTPVVNDPTGFTAAAAAAFNLYGTTLVGSALQLTDGGTGEGNIAWYNTPLNVQKFTTDFNFQDTAATADGFTFAMQNSSSGVWAIGTSGGGLGYQSIGTSVAVKFDLYSNSGEGSDSTGFYVNGAAPTVPSTDMTASGVNLHNGNIMHAHITYDGTTLTLTLTDTVTGASFTTSTALNIPATVGANTAYVGFTAGTGGAGAVQKILNWTYAVGTTTPASAAPTFSPAAGSYTGAQTVTLSDATAGSTIYYTVNGTTPTTASTVYSTPFSVGATETVNAIAVASGYTTSAVASAVYTITVPAAATPTFSPAAGTYANAQTVKLSDTTTGSTIYYTVNGTTPTTASTVYSAPLSVSATETVKAIAGAAGYSTSALASAAYTITVPATATPTFSPAAGSYTSTQTVVLSDATTGATIYYTTNGTTPTTASAVYSAPLSVSSSATVNAIAVASGYATSATGSAAYTISTVTPVVNDPTGFTAAAAAAFNLYGTTLVGSALQLTDGGTGEGNIAWYNTPLNVQKFTTDFNFQDTAATADGFTFAMQNSSSGVWAIGTSGGGLGYQSIGTSVAVKFDLYSNSGEGSDSTGFYVNGAAPTVPSTDMTASGVNLHNGNIMHAHITYDGTTLTLTLTDTVTGASFTTSTALNIPATVGANTAYVGFTAGTGGAGAVQKILNWTYAVN